MGIPDALFEQHTHTYSSDGIEKSQTRNSVVIFFFKPMTTERNPGRGNAAAKSLRTIKGTRQISYRVWPQRKGQSPTRESHERKLQVADISNLLIMLIQIIAIANMYWVPAVVPGTMLSTVHKLLSNFIFTSIPDGQVSGMKRQRPTVVKYPA